MRREGQTACVCSWRTQAIHSRLATGVSLIRTIRRRTSSLRSRLRRCLPRGTILLNGTPVTAGQFVPVSDLNAGRLVYTPLANVTGTTSFTFQVKDSGGTANGGIDLDPFPRTLTLKTVSVESHFHGTDGT